MAEGGTHNAEDFGIVKFFTRREKEMTYISGKITGKEDYRKVFAEAERKLKQEGKEVFNPAKKFFKYRDEPYIRLINRSLEALEKCDEIFMLKGWEGSTGARIEYMYAKKLRIKIQFDEDELY